MDTSRTIWPVPTEPEVCHIQDNAVSSVTVYWAGRLGAEVSMVGYTLTNIKE